MRRKFIILGAVALFLISGKIFAKGPDEGMWPLTMLSKLQDQMQARGLKLSAEDIYSLNKSSLKDAVVRLATKEGRMFCTGEIISNEGLFLTNHHCGYGAIQELSTPQDNILKNGFWAKDRGGERPANFNIMLLAKVEDITEKVLTGIEINQDEASRAGAIRAALGKANQEISAAEKAKGNEYAIEIMPFYNGNRFLAMFYVVYKDIRLVGTPPENMGKFGGDTDNWMWPRHTADFSMFRIYVGQDNKPASFNATNKPYTPNHFFPVSTSGISAGDYAMIMGYPGRTSRYAYSGYVNFLTDMERPARVNLRRAVLDKYEEYMHKDQNIRLMYADKHAGLSNYWKKFLGERDGLKALKVAERRKAFEDEFSAWCAKTGKDKKYGEALTLFKDVLEMQKKYGLFGVYVGDGLYNSQIFANALEFSGMADSLMAKDPKVKERAMKELAQMAPNAGKSFKEFYGPIERNVFETVVKMTYEGMDKSLQPADFVAAIEKQKADFAKITDQIMSTSIFADSNRMKAFLAKPNGKELSKDIAYIMASAFGKKSQEINAVLMPLQAKSGRANRLFQAGMMEMNPEKTYGPDANGTMRLTYGRVLDYEPKDAVKMDFLCTHKGILEKYKAGDYEFDAPDRLIGLLKAKDFGRWVDKNGNLPVCFLTDNDITGGNSGSPVINARGELIGTAFDGNWEAISSDFAFEPNLQRTINLDIRYTLFIVEKFAGASHLLNEMKLVSYVEPKVEMPSLSLPVQVAEPVKKTVEQAMPAKLPATKAIPKVKKAAEKAIEKAKS